jgi:hypothetical protein
MVEIVIAFLTGVLGPILILLIKNRLETKKKVKDPLTDAVFNANVVSDELDKLLIESGADRVWIAQFHNGGHYYPTGKSIQKFSFFFESVKAMKDSIKLNFQNIPVNLFSKMFGQILDSDTITIPDYRDEKIATYGLKYIAEETGTKSSYLFAIRAVDDRLIGVLGVDYTSRKRTLDQEQIINFRIVAATLGGVLMNHLTKH